MGHSSPGVYGPAGIQPAGNALNPVAGAELIRMQAAMDRLGGNFSFDEDPIRESADLPFAFETIARCPHRCTVRQCGEKSG
jgi:hypothetical protein